MGTTPEEKSNLISEQRLTRQKTNWKEITFGYLLLFAVAAIIIFFDQLTKSLIRERLPGITDQWLPFPDFLPFIKIVHWKNTGAAFGLFKDASTILAILAMIVALAIILYFPRIPKHEKLMRIALAMQLGGALGNLIDRFKLGYVVDFIQLGSFPVFNIADSSITVGVGLLLLAMWISEKKVHKELREQ